MKISKKIIGISLLPLLLFSSCDNKTSIEEMVKVVLEDGDYTCQNQIVTLPKGSDFTFNITLSIDKAIGGSSYTNYTISEEVTSDKRYDKITFHKVNYSTFISLQIVDSIRVNYEIDGEVKSEYVVKNHERINTSNDYDKYHKEGYCLSGWINGNNTVSLGSRIDADKEIILKPCYLKESETALFEYKYLDKNSIMINKYVGEEKVVVIPDVIDGHNVTIINKGAFADLVIDELVLSPHLAIVMREAFINCYIKQLILFDNLATLSNESFTNCEIDKVRINAIRNPSYIRTYFATYTEKFDRLLSLRDKKKIVLYGGSSVRFGFDSELIDQSFKDYEVVDMGVYAYVQAYPQIDIINMFTNKDDVIIVSPEFDTLETQLNIKPKIDDFFFAMCESNYDIISLLNISKYENFFAAFNTFQSRRNQLPSYPYSESAYHYDEDGHYIEGHSYNRYGDYIVYRKNNDKRELFGIRRAYYNKAYFPAEMIDNFNNAFGPLKDKGVTLLFDHSPRSNISISDDSTPSSIIELDEYLKKNVDMTFISSTSDGLMDPLYFYGTDNHLSTEGVSIRTKRVISSLLNGHYI